LGKRERELILKRWFGDEDMTDIEVYMELGMSQSTYYRIRGRAFFKLAFALKLEVYECDTDLRGN
jgi:ArpU family phage transcriptional regulator